MLWLTISFFIRQPSNMMDFFFAFQCLYGIFDFAILYCWVWRFWLLSFECKLLVYLNKTKWQSIINDQSPSIDRHSTSHHHTNRLHTDWYLTHKRTFGNFAYCGRRIIIPLIATSITIKIVLLALDIYLFHDNENGKHVQMSITSNICLYMNYLTPYCILLLIFRRIPKEWDNFFICSELRRICIALSMDYLPYLLNTILLFAIPSTNNNNAALIQIVQLNLSSFAQFVCAMIATHWVNKKVSPIIEQNKFELLNIEESRMPLIAVRSKTVTNLSTSTHAAGAGAHHLSLVDILSHSKSFDIFIKHLIAEFCIECLLSLVELVQFQQFVYCQYFRSDRYNSKYRLSDDYFNDALFKRISFPDSVPKSKIVYYGDDGQEVEVTESSMNIQELSMSRSKRSATHRRGSSGITVKTASMFHTNDFVVLKEEEEQKAGGGLGGVDVNRLYDKTVEEKEVDAVRASLMWKSQQLYDKYIAVGSQYEVNLAWTTRSKIALFFAKESKKGKERERKSGKGARGGKCSLEEFDLSDFIMLFDPVCADMFKLMKDSYDRFRRKHEYQKLKKMIGHQFGM